jgi:thymidylate synthase (FAD)
MTIVLDRGYLKLVEYWGDDSTIIESARMSTNKGFQGWDKDEKLLRYLYTNKHMTPFEMCGATFEIKAPIFVFREWHRHRTQSYNEMSARYTPLPEENYIPTVERLMMNANGTNKQANRIDGAPQMVEGHAVWVREALAEMNHRIHDFYMLLLETGVPKELARLILPINQYSKMRASANLRNWLQFLTLRMDEAAQWEIRQYANVLHDELSIKFPKTLALFDAEANRPSKSKGV